MKNKSRREEHEEHASEGWLVPYADILTLLLALFIILFASSQVDQKKYEAIMRGLSSAFRGGISVFEASNPARGDTIGQDIISIVEDKKYQESLRQEEEDLSEMKEKIDQYIKENNLTAQLETSITAEMLMISIRDYALFDSGSAIVKPEAQKLAYIISDILTEYPNYNVEVAGHTDNLPINTREFPTNWDLSARRALNFMKYLLENNNLDESRFKCVGYGEYRPIASNDTAEGRAKNRRVEVNIIRNVKPINATSVGVQ